MNQHELSINDIREILRISEIDIGVSDLEFIDKGGQKTVFKCFMNDKPYALKFCNITKHEGDNISSVQEGTKLDNADSTTLSRAKREIEIMNKVNTPYLVKLGPIGLTLTEYNEKIYLFFSEEFIYGSDLHSIIKKNKLSYEQTIDMALNLANAIDHLWDIKMVHRDIKPKNIMQRDNGEYILLDTGIAFDVQGEELTAAFHLIGTKIYMSPEQLNGYRRELDFRSDLFLLGIVMYEASTGIHPFYQPGNHTHQIISNILLTNLAPPSKMIEGFPKKLERIIMRLLAKEPHLRYKSCDRLIEQLSSLKEELL